ncbi:MAG: ABC transporter permease [Halobacteria archaeon]
MLRDGVRKRWRVARREISSLSTEKTIVLALMIQLFIAGFSSFLVVGLVSMYSPDSVSSSAVSLAITGDAGDEVIGVAGDSGVDIERVRSYSEGVRQFENGRVDGVVSANRTSEGGVSVKAVVPEGGIKTTLVVVTVKNVLVDLERNIRDQLSSRLNRLPIDLPPENSSSPYFSFTYTVLIPLLMFLPVFISGSVVADSITEEFERGTLDLLRVTPLSLREIMEGKMVAMVVIAPLQAALWLGLLMLNGTWIYHPFILLGFVSVISVLVVGFGAYVSLSFKDRQKSQFVYSLGVIAGFGAASVLPESLPNTVAKLAIGSASLYSYVSLLFYLVFAAVVWTLVTRRVDR